VNAAITVHGAQKPARPDNGEGRPEDRDILSAREAQFRYVRAWYAKTALDYGDRKNGKPSGGSNGKRACEMHISIGEPMHLQADYARNVPETGCDTFLSAINL